MPTKNLLFLLFCVLKTAFLWAQRVETLAFEPCFGGKPIQNDSVYYFYATKNSYKKTDYVQFETIRFYVRNVRFLYQNKAVFTQKNSAYLVDNALPNTKNISIKTKKKLKFDAVQFDIGIDSLTNTAGALAGDLDPTKGMYWTWQSGYINCKIEGKSNVCNTRNSKFQFHLGGYAGANNALQTVTVAAQPKAKTVVFIDLDTFLYNINLAKTNEIMSPSKDAVVLSKKIANSFRVQPKK